MTTNHGVHCVALDDRHNLNRNEVEAYLRIDLFDELLFSVNKLLHNFVLKALNHLTNNSPKCSIPWINTILRGKTLSIRSENDYIIKISHSINIIINLIAWILILNSNIRGKLTKSNLIGRCVDVICTLIKVLFQYKFRNEYNFVCGTETRCNPFWMTVSSYPRQSHSGKLWKRSQ